MNDLLNSSNRPSSCPSHPPSTGFRFTGSAAEYYPIWLTNIALTILTLGIYSAWAKVRRERYFHNHTLLAGAAFDYTANPMSILRGRMLIVLLIIVFAVIDAVFPPLKAVAILLLALASPWIITTAMRFRTRYTSYRNLNFRFSGTYGLSALYFIGWKILGYVSLGALVPLGKKKEREYIVDNIGYGGYRFQCEPRTWDFYKAYLLFLVFGFLPLFMTITLFAVRSAANAYLTKNPNGLAPVANGVENHNESVAAAAGLFNGPGAAFLMVLFGMLAIIAVPLTVSAFRVMLAKATWNSTSLAGMRFSYNVNAFRYAWISASNFVLKGLTLGLAAPYCAIRAYRYKVESLEVLAVPDFSLFTASAKEELRALGDQASDLYDVDIDLGF